MDEIIFCELFFELIILSR